MQNGDTLTHWTFVSFAQLPKFTMIKDLQSFVCLYDGNFENVPHLTNLLLICRMLDSLAGGCMSIICSYASVPEIPHAVKD